LSAAGRIWLFFFEAASIRDMDLNRKDTVGANCGHPLLGTKFERKILFINVRCRSDCVQNGVVSNVERLGWSKLGELSKASCENGEKVVIEPYRDDVAHKVVFGMLQPLLVQLHLRLHFRDLQTHLVN
jgi:hypothetical protein